MIAYEWGPPLDGDWLRQRHGPVRLVTGQVLQAARVGRFLPVLKEHTERCHLLDYSAVGASGATLTCRATSAEAGLKPMPVGAFSSSSTPLTPGLK